MLEPVDASKWFCNNCSHDWTPRHRAPRFRSIDDLVARAGLRRDELVTLADVGALNAFGYDRRSALWQAERAIRPAANCSRRRRRPQRTQTSTAAGSLCELANHERLASFAVSAVSSDREAEAECPLKPMTEAERLVADYAGMGLTAGRHPMALRRDELAMRGILRATDLRDRAPGPARPRRRHGHHAPASGHRERLRVPHARGRNRHRQHHRPPRSVRARSPRHRRGAVPDRGRRAAEARTA